MEFTSFSLNILKLGINEANIKRIVCKNLMSFFGIG